MNVDDADDAAVVNDVNVDVAYIGEIIPILFLNAGKFV